MDQLKRIWEAFIDFLTTYDSYKVTEMLHDLKWEEVTSNPYVWLIGLPSVGYMLVKKRFKTLDPARFPGEFSLSNKNHPPVFGRDGPLRKAHDLHRRQCGAGGSQPLFPFHAW